MPFLTLLDPRAKIKGSRDPLGFQPIWTRLGRQVIQNLTTVTTSVRGFTTLLLGLYFAGQAVEQRKADEANFPDLFLKFEQLAAYSRVAGKNGAAAGQDGESEILGIRRVKRNLQENRAGVRISAHQDHQILSNQRTYGLWGLYTVAARNSQLIEPGRPRLTPLARDFVEAEYLPRLRPVEQSIFSFLDRDQVFEPHHKHASLGANLAKLLGPHLTPVEITFYTKYLLFSGDENSLQRRLWERIQSVNLADPFSMPELKEVIKGCQVVRDEALMLRLEHIRQVECVIAPAGQLFGFLLSRDSQSLDQIIREVKGEWGAGLSHLDPTGFARALAAITDLNPETRTRLATMAQTLHSGQYDEVLKLLLAQNEVVMQERGSNAWVTVKNQLLNVRLREEEEDLSAGSALPDLWVNTYFINSLKLIGDQLQ
jgi:hypothetical protein